MQSLSFRCFFLVLAGCLLGALALPLHAEKKRHVSHPKKAVVHEDDDDSDDATATPSPTATPEASSSPASNYAPNASLRSAELKDFDQQPPRVQLLIEDALALTREDLTYSYGSSDPKNGGMDCSGFIYHVLTEHGFEEVPRDASGQYVWTRKAGTFRAVESRSEDSFELNEMRPGDLMFWVGTYDSRKDPPVTHTMIYLGREKESGKRVMVGSSDGRTYDGKKRWGVSVFDFTMPGQASRDKGVRFIGYAHIPGLDRTEANGEDASREEKTSR